MLNRAPFTHVSGNANRFKVMLRFLSKAGDKVDIITTDDTTPKDDLPKEAFGYPIHHTQGFTQRWGGTKWWIKSDLIWFTWPDRECFSNSPPHFPWNNVHKLTITLFLMFTLIVVYVLCWHALRPRHAYSTPYVSLDPVSLILISHHHSHTYLSFNANNVVISYHTHLPSYSKNYLGFIPGIE